MKELFSVDYQPYSISKAIDTLSELPQTTFSKCSIVIKLVLDRPWPQFLKEASSHSFGSVPCRELQIKIKEFDQLLRGSSVLKHRVLRLINHFVSEILEKASFRDFANSSLLKEVFITQPITYQYRNLRGSVLPTFASPSSILEIDLPCDIASADIGFDDYRGGIHFTWPIDGHVQISCWRSLHESLHATQTNLIRAKAVMISDHTSVADMAFLKQQQIDELSFYEEATSSLLKDPAPTSKFLISSFVGDGYLSVSIWLKSHVRLEHLKMLEIGGVSRINSAEISEPFPIQEIIFPRLHSLVIRFGMFTSLDLKHFPALKSLTFIDINMHPQELNDYIEGSLVAQQVSKQHIWLRMYTNYIQRKYTEETLAKLLFAIDENDDFIEDDFRSESSVLSPPRS